MGLISIYMHRVILPDGLNKIRRKLKRLINVLKKYKKKEKKLPTQFLFIISSWKCTQRSRRLFIAFMYLLRHYFSLYIYNCIMLIFLAWYGQ